MYHPLQSHMFIITLYNTTLHSLIHSHITLYSLIHLYITFYSLICLCITLHSLICSHITLYSLIYSYITLYSLIHLYITLLASDHCPPVTDIRFILLHVLSIIMYSAAPWRVRAPIAPCITPGRPPSTSVPPSTCINIIAPCITPDFPH